MQVTKEASRATSYVPKMLTPADLTNLLASTRAELNPGASKMGEPVSQETIFLSREEHKMQSRELMRQKRAKQGLTRIVLPEIAELYQEEVSIFLLPLHLFVQSASLLACQSS